MKRTIILAVSVMLVIFAAMTAFAAETPVGNTGLYLSIPSGYSQEALTKDDISEGMVAYWSGSRVEIAVYAEDSDGYTLDEYMEEICDYDDITDCGMIDGTISGLSFGYYSFEVEDGSDSYYCESYVTVYNGQIVEFCFFMDSDKYSETAEDIIATLTTGRNAVSTTTTYTTQLSGSYVSIGNTGLSVMLPSGYNTEKLTAQDKADDMVASWTTDYLGIAVWVYDSGCDSEEEILEWLNEDDDAPQESGINMMPCGRNFAYAVYIESDYIEIDYITVLNGDTVQIGFTMDSEDLASGSAQAASIMESLR